MSFINIYWIELSPLATSIAYYDNIQRWLVVVCDSFVVDINYSILFLIESKIAQDLLLFMVRHNLCERFYRYGQNHAILSFMID